MSRLVDLEQLEGLMAEMPFLRPTLPHDLPFHQNFVEEVVQLREKKGVDEPFRIDVGANQGAGKTVRGRIFEKLFALMGYSIRSLSIDDLYLKHEDFYALRKRSPGFESRGVTHDLPLFQRVYESVMNMGDTPILMPGPYDKGAHRGAGDRYLWVNPQQGVHLKARLQRAEIVLNGEQQVTPVLRLNEAAFKGRNFGLDERMGSPIPLVPGFFPKEPKAEDSPLRKFLFDNVDTGSDLEVFVVNVGGKEMVRFQTMDQSKATVEYDAVPAELPPGWRVVEQKPQFFFREGWMQDLRPVNPKVFDDSSLLTSPEYKGVFRNEADIQFAKCINKLLEDYLPVWDQADYGMVIYHPRYQISMDWRIQQEKPLQAEGRGMTDDQIKTFVRYFWRSLHPNFFLHQLARDTQHIQKVTVVNDNRQIVEVTTPAKLDEVLARLSTN